MFKLAAAAVFVVFSGGVAAQVAASRSDVASAPSVEVLRPGTGSFASYLRQSSGSVAPAYVLRKGELVHEALQAWAKAAGWELIWYPDVSWKVLADTSFSSATDITAAVAEVVTILRDERRPVRLEIADGNRIMEVISTDVVSNREAFSD